MATQNMARRQFGRRLAQFRQAHGYTGRGLAPELGITQGTLSKLENGKHLPSDKLLGALGKALRLTRDEQEELRALASAATTRLHRVQFRHEAAYTQIQRVVSAVEYQERRVLQLSLVPGLLQTRRYAQALFSAVSDSAADVKGAVAERRAQARQLRSASRQFRFLIHEAALRSPVGDNETMRQQLDHLEQAMAREHVQIGVLPLATDYAGQRLEPPQSGFDLFDDTLLTIDLNGCWLNVEDAAAVHQYSEYFEALWTRAALRDNHCRGVLRAARRTFARK